MWCNHGVPLLYTLPFSLHKKHMISVLSVSFPSPSCTLRWSAWRSWRWRTSRVWSSRSEQKSKSSGRNAFTARTRDEPLLRFPPVLYTCFHCYILMPQYKRFRDCSVISAPVYLSDPFQSGFRPLHCTETTLVRVVGDPFTSDSGSLPVLSSAFD